MTLTVLMPVRRYHPGFLRAAVASVRDQDDPDWRLLVLVEHDTEAAICHTLSDALIDERVRVVAREGPGLAAALNHGMRMASSEFVAILLGDDLWAPEAVRVLRHSIARNPAVDFFHSARRFIDEEGRPLSTTYEARERVVAADFVAGSPVKHLLCWRRALALQHGGMDESLPSVGPDDFDFPWCMLEWGARFQAVKECLYLYRDHREAYRLTTHLPLTTHREGIRRILAKHGVPGPVIEERLEAATTGYLRQCLYQSEDDRAQKEAEAVPARAGWRETYRPPRDSTWRPPISVVVPAWNAEATLGACLQSIVEQDYPADKVELLVVDNASVDDTRRVAEAFAPRVTVLQEPVRGPAAARNCGLRRASHALVVMTDADCVADPHWLGQLVAPLRDDGVDVVGGRILALRPGSVIERFGEVIHDHARSIERESPPYVITMNWASRRSVLERCGYFDPGFLRGEDVDWSFRVARAGGRMVYASEAIVYHRNERTLRGVLHEGYVHGFHAVPLLSRHRDWLATMGHRPPWPRPWQPLQHAAAARRDGAPLLHATCIAAFGLGKALGTLAGRLRFSMAGRDSSEL